MPTFFCSLLHTHKGISGMLDELNNVKIMLLRSPVGSKHGSSRKCTYATQSSDKKEEGKHQQEVHTF